MMIFTQKRAETSERWKKHKKRAEIEWSHTKFQKFTAMPASEDGEEQKNKFNEQWNSSGYVNERESE